MPFIKKRKVPSVICIIFCSVISLICFGVLCGPANEVPLGVKGGALGIMTILLVFLIWAILELRRKQAGIAISQEGITDHTTLLGCGFVPWSNVEKIIIVSNKGHCYAYFNLRDYKSVLDQSPGRFARFINVLYNFLGFLVVVNMQGYKLKPQEIASLLESTYGQFGIIEYK